MNNRQTRILIKPYVYYVQESVSVEHFIFRLLGADVVLGKIKEEKDLDLLLNHSFQI